MQCFPATVVEHARAGRQVRTDVLRDRVVVHVAVAGIDVDRMLGIPEGDPIAHYFVPRSPEAGGGYGNRRPPPRARARGAPYPAGAAIIEWRPRRGRRER